MKELPAYILSYYNQCKSPSESGQALANSILFFVQNYTGNDETAIEFLSPLMQVVSYLARLKVRVDLDAEGVEDIIELVRKLNI